METFIKITKTDEYDDVVMEVIEEANAVSAIASIIETELLDDLVTGAKITLSVVEMAYDEVERFNEENGYV